MNYGSPWGAPWGEPDNHIEYIYASQDVEGAGTLYHIRMKARTNYGNMWYQVFISALYVKTIYLTEGKEEKLTVSLPWGITSNSIFAMCIGSSMLPGDTYENVARCYEHANGKRVAMNFTFIPEVIVNAAGNPLDDNGYTSNWTVTGLVYGQNCQLVSNSNTRGSFALSISVVAGVCYVVLSCNGVEVAGGNATVLGAPFAMTLKALNNSGLTFTFTMSNTVANYTGSIQVRWPESMKIKRGLVNPPTVVVKTYPFDGRNVIRWADPDDLTNATYYYRFVPVSDTGKDGTASAVQSQAVSIAPNAPTALHYISGTHANLIVGWTASTTPAIDEYDVYWQRIVDDVMNLNDLAVAAVIPPTVQAALPAFAAAAGKVRIIVRAKKGGVQERNLNILELEFDAAGNYVAPRPNLPAIVPASIDVTGGLDIALRANYDKTYEKGVATQVQLFKRTPSGSYNYATPIDTQPLSASTNGLQKASLSYSFAAAGYYYIRVLAATAGGVLSDPTNAPEQLIFVSDEVIATAADISTELSRS